MQSEIALESTEKNLNLRNSNCSKKSTYCELNYFELYLSQADETAKLRSIVQKLTEELKLKDERIQASSDFLIWPLDAGIGFPEKSEFSVQSHVKAEYRR